MTYYETPGLLQGTEDGLDRLRTISRWPTYGAVESRGASLNRKKSRTVATWVSASDGMLAGFVDCADASPEAVASFASRWGLLGVCEHGLPISHVEAGRLDIPSSIVHGRTSATVDIDQDCQPSSLNEPLAPWRYWASVAGAFLRIATAINLGRPSRPEDWEVLVADGPWVRQTHGLDRIREHLATGRECAAASVSDQMELVASGLTRWLGLTAVAPVIVWIRAVPEIRVSDGDLFGSLALATALTIGDAEAWRTCPGCGRQFLPIKSRRRAAYCSTCREAGMSQRIASRRYRAVRKAADPDFLAKERERVRAARLRQSAGGRTERP